MSADEAKQKFSESLNGIINEALQNRVPVAHIILELDVKHHETQMLFLELRAQAAAHQAAKAIVPATGFIAKPPNRG